MVGQDPVLTVEHLVKEFALTKGTFTAVDAISFKLYPGEILGLLGPNGAGKTTIIHMLLSVLTPTSGLINYFGYDFFTHRSKILEHVSFASTYVRLPARLTVRENLDIYGRLYNMSTEYRAEKIEYYLKLFNMWHMRNSETGVLSAGQITRVMLAKAFLTSPKIVLLDEPTASLDPDIARNVRQFIIEQQREHGISLLVTSHNMDEVTDICDRVLVLKKGKIIADSTPEQLSASVTKARIHLTTEDPQKLIAYAQAHNMSYTYENNTTILLEIDEQSIALFLHSLGRAGIMYTTIAIDKPTLEDYFLQVASGE
jgi:ABC-2 type transport system ATP-binding protein